MFEMFFPSFNTPDSKDPDRDQAPAELADEMML